RGILLSVCVCSAMAFLLAMRLRSGYVSALEKSLVERAIELDPALVEDSTTHSLLMQTLVAQRPPSSPAMQAAAPTRAPAPPNDSFVRSAAELRSGDAQRANEIAGKLGPE